MADVAAGDREVPERAPDGDGPRSTTPRSAPSLVCLALLATTAGCARREPGWCHELATRMAAGTVDVAGAAQLVGVAAGADPDHTGRLPSRRPGVAAASVTRPDRATAHHLVVEVWLAPSDPIRLSALTAAHGDAEELPNAVAMGPLGPVPAYATPRMRFRLRPTTPRVEASLTAATCPNDRSLVCSLVFDSY